LESATFQLPSSQTARSKPTGSWWTARRREASRRLVLHFLVRTRQTPEAFSRQGRRTAYARQQAKIAELNAQNHGLKLEDQDTPGKLLVVAVENYLDEIRLTKKPKTLAAYTTALRYFQESCQRECIEQIERKDLLRFSAFLETKSSNHHVPFTRSSKT
jgi:hypothetical protein